MIVFHKKHTKAIKWYKQVSGNLMQICFKSKGPDIIVNCAYAPYSGKNHTFEKREKWFNDLTQHLLVRNNKMQFTLGDFNTRFHAKTQDDTQIGKFVFGRGEEFLKNVYKPEETNRTLFTETLDATNSFVMNTFSQNHMIN